MVVLIEDVYHWAVLLVLPRLRDKERVRQEVGVSQQSMDSEVGEHQWPPVQTTQKEDTQVAASPQSSVTTTPLELPPAKDAEGRREHCGFP